VKKILILLLNSPVAISFRILDYRAGKDFQYFKIEVVIKDGPILFIREYQSLTDFKYSYHWQRADNTLISRWDNAPHHPDSSTYPHHRHTSKHQIEPFPEARFAAVLAYIEQELKE
jgi:hypothetical protein